MSDYMPSWERRTYFCRRRWRMDTKVLCGVASAACVPFVQLFELCCVVTPPSPLPSAGPSDVRLGRGLPPPALTGPRLTSINANPEFKLPHLCVHSAKHRRFQRRRVSIFSHLSMFNVVCGSLLLPVGTEDRRRAPRRSRPVICPSLRTDSRHVDGLLV